MFLFLAAQDQRCDSRTLIPKTPNLKLQCPSIFFQDQELIINSIEMRMIYLQEFNREMDLNSINLRITDAAKCRPRYEEGS
jgi:hypothetical protein